MLQITEAVVCDHEVQHLKRICTIGTFHMLNTCLLTKDYLSNFQDQRDSRLRGTVSSLQSPKVSFPKHASSESVSLSEWPPRTKGYKHKPSHNKHDQKTDDQQQHPSCFEPDLGPFQLLLESLFCTKFYWTQSPLCINIWLLMVKGSDPSGCSIHASTSRDLNPWQDVEFHHGLHRAQMMH